jgi:hypothetical protein
MSRKLAVLVASLGLAASALVVSDTVLARRSHEGSPLAAACVPPRPPGLAEVGARRSLALRAVVEAALRPAGGHGYAWGPVAPTVVWSDDEPLPGALEPGREGRWPGSFEVRQWSPDPTWGASYQDDVVADVFLFPGVAQASTFFTEATSVRCHSSGRELAISFPLHARVLHWVNPDNVVQLDLFFQDGSLVYRFSDVRPQRKSPHPSVSSRVLGAAAMAQLACRIPGVRCVRAPSAGSTAA